MNRLRRVGVIVNPISGAVGHRAGEGASREARARRVLADLGVDHEIAVTRQAGEAGPLARDLAARGCDRIIAWGGDGTVHEAAAPLIGTSTAIGVVRSGSGDGFGRSLGVPRAPEAAIRVAVAAEPHAIDVGYLAGRHFLNVAGIGFDATVARDFNLARRRGQLGYLTRTLTMVWTYRCRRYAIDVGPERSDATRFLVAFANGPEYGNRLVLDAAANPADGWLNAVVVADGSAITQMWRMRRLAFGLRRPASGIFRYRVQTAKITGDRLVCQVDGETFETSGTIEVRVAPKALLVAV
jgi:YegS/Rv2252/BmrU family lipid kinase